MWEPSKQDLYLHKINFLLFGDTNFNWGFSDSVCVLLPVIILLRAERFHSSAHSLAFSAQRSTERSFCSAFHPQQQSFIMAEQPAFAFSATSIHTPVFERGRQNNVGKIRPGTFGWTDTFSHFVFYDKQGPPRKPTYAALAEG